MSREARRRARGQRLARRLATALALLAGAAASAGEADVVSARARCDAARVCSFEVSVRHADAGWQHYADRFEVLSLQGEVLGVRVLQHPHVEEQPVTRHLAGVRVPPGVERVCVRARDSLHGFGGSELEVPLEFPQAAK